MKLISKYQKGDKVENFFSKLWKAFTNASIGAAMAENASVMTASGWRNKDGKWRQDQVKEAEQLRDNLAIISGFSPTNPVTAAGSAVLKGLGIAGNKGLLYLNSHTKPTNTTATRIINAFGLKELPKDYAYRRTLDQELKDIKESGVFREMPDGITVPSTKVFTTSKGDRFMLHKAYGNSHGGKAFSKGEPWLYTTSSGSTGDEIIIGIPGNNNNWRVGHHGHYSEPRAFNDITHGSGLWMPFGKDGVVEGVLTKGLRSYKKVGDKYRRY